MQKEIKLRIQNNRVLIEEKQLGFSVSGGIASGSEVVPTSMLIATVDNKYLWKAIMFSRSDEANNLLADTVASMRIARDESGEQQVIERLNAQIKQLTDFMESVERDYQNFKSIIKNNNHHGNN